MNEPGPYSCRAFLKDGGIQFIECFCGTDSHRTDAFAWQAPDGRFFFQLFSMEFDAEEAPFVIRQDGPREKMSKSRGNVIPIDDVVLGVSHIPAGYEFRDMWGVPVPMSEVRRLRENDNAYVHKRTRVVLLLYSKE